MIGPAEQVFLSNELQDMKYSGESLNSDRSRSSDFVQGLHLKMLYHRRPDWQRAAFQCCFAAHNKASLRSEWNAVAHDWRRN